MIARRDRARDAFDERLTQLGAVVALGGERLEAPAAQHAAALAERAEARLGHGTTFTVAALAGATGSGKSSLFNALTGAELAEVAATRPATSATRAAVFGPAPGETPDGDAAGLLDWLGVARRHHLPGTAGAADVVDAAGGAELTGLVLLDLPDHDSTEAEHRAEVERLAEVVDLFVWVVDPQKYADAALHQGFLQRYAGHHGVTLVVLNQADRLGADERRACLAHLETLLAEDGLGAVRVLAASATTGQGVDVLRRELAARAAERRAAVARLAADLDWVSAELAAAVGDVTPAPVSAARRRALAESLGRAAHADAVADAVASAHRRQAVMAAGWPPTRWLRRLRPDPLRRLGLGRARRAGREASTADAPAAPPRTNLPLPPGAAQAAVGAAVRDLAGESAAGLPEPLRRRVHEVAHAREADVADALDRAVGSARLPTHPPPWQRPFAAVQTAFTTALAVGLAWLTALFVVAWLRLPDPPTPELGPLPLPTVLALGGAGAGLGLAALARALAARGARRRRSQTRALLNAAAGRVGEELIVEPLDAELVAIAELQDAVRRLAR